MTVREFQTELQIINWTNKMELLFTLWLLACILVFLCVWTNRRRWRKNESGKKRKNGNVDKKKRRKNSWCCVYIEHIVVSQILHII